MKNYLFILITLSTPVLCEAAVGGYINRYEKMRALEGEVQVKLSNFGYHNYTVDGDEYTSATYLLEDTLPTAVDAKNSMLSGPWAHGFDSKEIENLVNELKASKTNLVPFKTNAVKQYVGERGGATPWRPVPSCYGAIDETVEIVAPNGSTFSQRFYVTFNYEGEAGFKKCFPDEKAWCKWVAGECQPSDEPPTP